MANSSVTLKVKRLHPGAILPVYATAGAACFDLHALFPVDQSQHWTAAGTSGTVRTGLAFEVPEGWVMLIYSRSGHGFKNNIRLANSVGVIDSDYRGEVLVKLSCDQLTESEFSVRHGDRIAQAMLVPVHAVAFEEVEELSITVRGTNGLGSTGS